MKPSSGASSLGSSGATSRILAGRPWLAPALGLLVIAAAVATWWALAPTERRAPPVSELVVVPGLRSVRVSFLTPRPVRATVDVSPATARTKLPAPREPATEHRFEITGLREATPHRLTIYFEGGGQLTQGFVTQALLIEGLKKQAKLDRLKLSWSTTLPVKSSVVYQATGTPAMHQDLPEAYTTRHSVELAGLSPDRDYEVTLVCTTERGEVQHSQPFKVKLFTTAANGALEEIERAAIPKKILDAFWQLRHKRPDRARIAQLLGENLDGLRPPVRLIADIAREFYGARDVFVESKLKVYSALKLVEHVERLARVRSLPFVPMTERIDYGTWAQTTTSLGDPALMRPMPKKVDSPLPWTPPLYIVKPEVLPGIDADQQLVTARGGPLPMVETRPFDQEHAAVEVFGSDRDGAPEMAFRFAVSRPKTVQRAEVWLAYRGASPLQFFELDVNGRGPLVIRPPAKDEPMKWNVDAHGVDPALLVPGDNLVKVRLKPLPEVIEGRRAFVWFAELRVKRRAREAGP